VNLVAEPADVLGQARFGRLADDRHANFPAGTIDPQALLAVVRAAGAPVVCETPEAGLAEDIGWLREQVS
jgi:endonuclease IV